MSAVSERGVENLGKKVNVNGNEAGDGLREGIEKDERFMLAEKYVQETGVSVFLTGKAGTGKTTFLRHIVSSTTKRCAVIAPTGVAAINAGGVTIHSFFQLPLCPYLPDVKELVTEYQLSDKYRSMNRERIKILRTLDLLIIDEISMVRADLLDAVDATLRRYRRNDKPFGGVQLLMIGDIQQLPPVVTDADKPYMDMVYPSSFFFNSKALQKLQYIVIELDKIYRQTNVEFMDILNDIRSGHPVFASLQKLNQRLIPGFTPPENGQWIRLTTHNYQADSVNKVKIDALECEPAIFEAEIQGSFPETAYPAETSLSLKPGAQVMFTKNDSSGERLYYNGKIGTVKSVEPEIIVTDEHGNDIIVPRETWENMKYGISEETNEITAEVEGSFTQYPLKLAWAITIHKSQGLTFDKVIIDAGKAFSFGQVYVALSRCRTLEGIVLSSPISRNCTFTSQEVTAFERQFTPVEQAQSALDSFRVEYFTEQLCGIFNLRHLNYLYDKLNRIWQNDLTKLYPAYAKTFGSLSSINREMSPAVPGFEELAETGNRFQSQLRRIIASEGTNSSLLAERILKAATYFHTQISILAKSVTAVILIEIDNKEVKKIYKIACENFLKELRYRLLTYMAIIGDGFTLRHSSKIRTDCELERFITLKAFVKAVKETLEDKGGKSREDGKDDSGKTTAGTSRPEVMEALVAWRKEKYTAENISAFMVLHQKTLLQIAEILPRTKEELMQAEGFGKAKWEKYGKELLSLLKDFQASDMDM